MKTKVGRELLVEVGGDLPSTPEWKSAIKTFVEYVSEEDVPQYSSDAGKTYELIIEKYGSVIVRATSRKIGNLRVRWRDFMLGAVPEVTLTGAAVLTPLSAPLLAVAAGLVVMYRLVKESSIELNAEREAVVAVVLHGLAGAGQVVRKDKLKDVSLAQGLSEDQYKVAFDRLKEIGMFYDHGIEVALTENIVIVQK